MSDKIRDKFRGCILGLAIGDALGYPVEFIFSLEDIDAITGGKIELPDPAIFTDDTQMSLCVAQALVELNQRQADAEAIGHLNQALQQESRSPGVWRLLAVAYGRTGNLGMTSLALAERALLERKQDEALAQGARAERMLPTGSPGWLRAQDIQFAAKKHRD